jgi:hypothetical protein
VIPFVLVIAVLTLAALGLRLFYLLHDGFLALSQSLAPGSGAANVPAASRLWRESFSHPQFLWLPYRFTHRTASPPPLWQYMHSHFRQICTGGYGGKLYRRTVAGSA